MTTLVWTLGKPDILLRVLEHASAGNRSEPARSTKARRNAGSPQAKTGPGEVLVLKRDT